MTILMAPMLITNVIIIVVGTVLPEVWRAEVERSIQTVIFTADFTPVFLAIVIILFVVAITRLADGTVLEGRGVIPGIEIALDRALLLQGGDSQLEAAINYLEQK